MKALLSILALSLLLFSCTEETEETNEHTIENEELSDEEVSEVSYSNNTNPELLNFILEKDSLLFQVGFNQIDTQMVALLVAEDFEFYHDEHGITNSKEDFLESIVGIGELPFTTWRALVEGSTEVFPMYRNNKEELYGILQNGSHEFYQQHDGEEPVKTSTAKFSHLWILENGDWKLKRVFSYDH